MRLSSNAAPSLSRDECQNWFSQHIRQALHREALWVAFFYAASTMMCEPASLSQEVGLALGAQAGESKLRKVVEAGGFTQFRRAPATPCNLILEAST